MSTNNREFDFFALMASLEAHMLKDPNVRDASPSEALENYFSRKGKRSQRRKNAFRAQRHRRDVMAEKFDTTSKNDGILRKTYKDGYAKFESSHGRVKKEDKSNSYHCKHPRERRRIEAANSKLADYMQSDICLDLYDSVFDDDDDYDTYMGQLFYDNLVYIRKNKLKQVEDWNKQREEQITAIFGSALGEGLYEELLATDKKKILAADKNIGEYGSILMAIREKAQESMIADFLSKQDPTKLKK